MCAVGFDFFEVIKIGQYHFQNFQNFLFVPKLHSYFLKETSPSSKLMKKYHSFLLNLQCYRH